MIFILSSFFWLTLSIIAHIILNKMRLVFKLSRAVNLLVFVVGLVLCSATGIFLQEFVTPIQSISLLMTSLVLYIALAFAYASITATPSLGDRSPSAKIVLQILHHGKQTEEQILSLFNHEDILRKRINDLIGASCLKEKKGMITVTSRGKQLARFFMWYRRILKIKQGG